MSAGCSAGQTVSGSEREQLAAEGAGGEWLRANTRAGNLNIEKAKGEVIWTSGGREAVSQSSCKHSQSKGIHAMDENGATGLEELSNQTRTTVAASYCC